MDLDRGTLARIDRKLLSGLGQEEAFRMVRLPVTEAKWSTWKRYCDAAGISMGRAIMALLERELVSVLGKGTWDESPIFAGRAEEQLAAREAQIAARERDLDAVEERLRGWTKQLRLREGELEALKQQIQLVPKPAHRRTEASRKVGRNDRCPCGSGLKFKRCHGS
ncbi:MAG: SEC-C metal-binding domain-containing protein [Acidimicrobiia bacterium]|nr:SEC-C metal-binding domain-containing protein [Acidimicrobiia bacterium]MDH3469698.1 SEC-C metal-binding domain-containing protein [Acidimicrobiia bacterium]